MHSKGNVLHTISTYLDALKAIWNRSGYDRGFISNPFAGNDAARLGLTRTRVLLEHAGYHQLPYQVVHVAGSKGKGSTSAKIDAMLRAGGVVTGRFTSPHLHSFRERFVVDGAMISEHDFTELTDRFIHAAEAVEQQRPELGGITAFELNTAMALAWFADQECEVAVVEVGMGGALDSTNIVDPAVSVITTLDFEHTAVLGSTLAEIACNKAGIIKRNRPVVVANQPREALEVITDIANSHQAPLSVAGQDWNSVGTHSNFSFIQDGDEISWLTSSLTGPHQVENAGLAIAAVRALGANNPTFELDVSAIRNGLETVTMPARFEQVWLPSGQRMVIDGAHTPASTSALARSVQEEFPGTSIVVVIGMLADKEHHAVLEPLATIAATWIVTAPDSPRALPTEELKQSVLTLSSETKVAGSVEQGISLAKHMGTDVIVVTGSFSTAAEARVALGLAGFIDPPVQT